MQSSFTKGGLTPELSSGPEDLIGIIDLQRINLKQNITPAEKNAQGFVTLEHSLRMLQQMHDLAPSVIVKDNDKVIAYALTELKEIRHIIKEYEPLYALLDTLMWKGRPLNHYRYYVMGQICVASDYRGKGLVDLLYQYHRKVYHPRFDLFVTEISTQNLRSMRAHEKTGFVPLHTHRDHLDEWTTVVWDWRHEPM